MSATDNPQLPVAIDPWDNPELAPLSEAIHQTAVTLGRVPSLETVQAENIAGGPVIYPMGTPEKKARVKKPKVMKAIRRRKLSDKKAKKFFVSPVQATKLIWEVAEQPYYMIQFPDDLAAELAPELLLIESATHLNSVSIDPTGNNYVDPTSVVFVQRWRIRQSEENLQLVAAFGKKHKFDFDSDLLIRAKMASTDGKHLFVKSSAKSDSIIELPKMGKNKFIPFQKAGIAYSLLTKHTFIADEMGLGKAQPLDAKILTPTGWTTMGELSVGDEVVGVDGMPCTVTGIYPQGKKKVHKVTFTDDTFTECCSQHLWEVNTPRRKSAGRPFFTMPLDMIKKVGLRGGNVTSNRRFIIPLVKPVHFDQQNHPPLPLHPYLLGSLLGDGGMAQHHVGFTTADVESLARLAKLLPESVEFRKINGQVYDYGIRRLAAGGKNEVIQILKKLGLQGTKSATKFIPKLYLFATIKERIALLQGLMDTDGYVTATADAVQYTTMSKQLFDDVRFIVQSLGGIARQGSKGQTLTITLPRSVGSPFLLSRKRARYSVRIGKYAAMRAIDKIEELGYKEMQCIMVDSPDHLYITDHCIVTHNTIQAIGVMAMVKKFPVLVICPNTLKLNWKDECIKWFGKKREVTVLKHSSLTRLEDTMSPARRRREVKKGVAWMKEQDVIIVNYDKIKKWVDYFKALKPEVVIFDESHYLKGNSNRSRICKELMDEVNPEYLLMLTGTPVMSRPQDLIRQLQIMGRMAEFGGVNHFWSRYCNVVNVDMSQLPPLPKPDENGNMPEPTAEQKLGMEMRDALVRKVYENQMELNRRLRSVCYVRREKTDVLTDLPDKLRSTLTFEISNRAEYERIQEDVSAYLGDRAAKDEKFLKSIKKLSKEEQVRRIKEQRNTAEYKSSRAEALVRIEMLKQAAAIGKLGSVQEWVEDFFEQNPNKKLVMFATHKAIINELEAMFPDISAVVRGEDNDTKRHEAVHQFMTNKKKKLFIGSLKAAGVGITLTSASDVAFVELGWTPAIHDQAEDRCHRITQKSTVTAYYLLAEDTIEERIAKLIESKRQTVDAVSFGDPLEKVMQTGSILGDLVAELIGKRTTL